MDIKTKLLQLMELDDHLEVLKIDKQRAIDTIITDEIRRQLSAIDDELDPLSIAVRETFDQLESEVKVAVLEHGATVKPTSGYTATFVKGRVSWDTKALDGYAAAHPEIERFKKVGSPSVRLLRGRSR